MAKITVEFNGEQAKLDAALMAFSLHHGWEAQVVDPNDANATIANPVTSLVYARNVLTEFVRESVKAYQAKVTAEAARVAALNATTAELDTMSTSAVME